MKSFSVAANFVLYSMDLYVLVALEETSSQFLKVQYIVNRDQGQQQGFY